MLYRDADYIKDVEWVIFDEVHYINDDVRYFYFNGNRTEDQFGRRLLLNCLTMLVLLCCQRQYLILKSSLIGLGELNERTFMFNAQSLDQYL